MLFDPNAVAFPLYDYGPNWKDQICCSFMPGSDCSRVPDGDIAQINGKYCDAVSETRDCRPFTLLRHPMDRLVSAYNYFCLSCAQGGKACNRETIFPENQSGNPYPYTCPDMTIVDYAKHLGSYYVSYFADCRGFDCDEAHYNHALAYLNKTRPLVLFLEGLYKPLFGMPPGVELLASFLGESDLPTPDHPTNAQAHSFEPSQEERNELVAVLALDLKLYDILMMVTYGRSYGVAQSRHTSHFDFDWED